MKQTMNKFATGQSLQLLMGKVRIEFYLLQWQLLCLGFSSSWPSIIASGGDNVDGMQMEGNSLVSEEYAVPIAFTKLKPGNHFSMQFKWKRYRGDYSIGVFIPTKYGNTVFEICLNASEQILNPEIYINSVIGGGR